MANIDKTSLRNEVGRLKADFEQLCLKGKVSGEVKIIMNSMLMIIELMLVIFLERVTQKNSKNSSKPSSQTQKDESALNHPGSNGKGKNENKALAKNTKVNETVRISRVQTCPVCGEDLTNTPCVHHERRTKIDIIFEKVVEHVDAEIKHCPTCDSTVKGQFPSEMYGPLQYGDGLKAFVVNLLVCQMVSLNRVQKLVKSMIGVVLAEASLLKFVLRLHLALEAWELQTKEALLESPAMNVDETSLRVARLNYWIHVYSSGDLTLKILHRKRGKEAIEAIDIIPRYGGVIIHDCWASYLSYHHCGHGLCGSHLLRELTFIVDWNDYKFTRHLSCYLQKTRTFHLPITGQSVT